MFPSNPVGRGSFASCFGSLGPADISFSQASSDKKQLDVGANLFIGNLDENVDERLLYDTFSAFGQMATTAKVCGCSVLSIVRWELTFDIFHTIFRLDLILLVPLKLPRLLATQAPAHPKVTVSPLTWISTRQMPPLNR